MKSVVAEPSDGPSFQALVEILNVLEPNYRRGGARQRDERWGEQQTAGGQDHGGGG